ncbi:hypothetical protein E1263_10345 [Kribbella antibiotica]|uniref:OmpA-like domain-containing protein n=1 Tax=Kribbella antibiotica TaxID=190195 RepID=A0A4R4ZR38_9ACTN|nr:OmpA family protein [Kribbella antibiotica]TDD60666.1 hypothetical protein E1263_10345 [Kribbella antibiotica]
MQIPRILTVGLVCAALLGLTGCGPPEQHGGATALVIGNRQNMPAPLLTQAASAALNAAIERGDRLVIVSVTGDPKMVAKSDLACTHGTTKACEQFTKKLLKEIPSIVTKYPADAGEASLFSAIKVARDNISSLPGPKQIITIDSGLDTTGPLSLKDLSVLDSDPVTIGKKLKAGHYSPDLNGISVLMTGLGQTAAPQGRLTSPDSARLTALWTDVLAEAGAVKPIQIASDSLPAGRRAASLPTVGVTKRPAPPDPRNLCRQFKFNEAQLGFASDSATFIDRHRARDALRGLAKGLKQTGFNIVLTGTTAYKENNPSNPLSKARANAAKGILVELGVPGQRILTQGVGIDWTGYHAPNGPVEAISMRLVLMDPTCPR